ncbi:hypothetical protein [Nitrobacter sp. JJSN]|uniref:hypothetical protein n=1 Tax=Nitrobacter sp. JJSN TaxID=3453033 RepID=UPI003F7748DE
MEKTLNSLKARLTEEAEAYPVNANIDALDVWRKGFDQLRQDIERLEFAKKNPVRSMYTGPLSGTRQGHP